MAIQVLQRVGPNCDRKRLLRGIARPGIRFSGEHTRDVRLQRNRSHASVSDGA
jgi:hypothetical protein